MANKVVMTVTLGPDQLEKEALGKIGATLVIAQGRTEDEVIANCQDADGVLIGANEPFTKRVIESLHKCKVISRFGIGYDNVDVKAATEKGIAVSIVPDYCVNEVSDNAMAFILAFARKILPFIQAVRAGQWKAGTPLAIQIGRETHRFQTQTLGIIGLGRIGKALTPKAQAFGLKVIAYDPYLSQAQVEQLGVRLVQFEQLLRESDYISVHAPLTSETRHLINLEAFKKMKPTAYFINNARGGIVDEQALYTALSDRIIAGAGIDVTEPEPPKAENPLLQLDNILITPHSAWFSQESVVEMRQRAVEAVVQVLQGGWPRFMADPELKERR